MGQNRLDYVMTLEEAVAAFRRFCGPDLTHTLSQVEAAVNGATSHSLEPTLESCGARLDVLVGAGQLKRIVGQINVVIHALGILLCLPRLLEPEETIQYVSLGAGNTGRAFDLETDRRIAEFKFIQWQGGSESIRHNSLSKSTLRN